MCGLTGFIDFARNSSPGILDRMTHTLYHRGPDDKGTWFADAGYAQLGFGFRRLSIIDLSEAGHQPMINERTGEVLVFNGEVYNFHELRKELEACGHRFTGHCDTEVVLHAFQEWGTACVNRFIGMFAIVIFNPATRAIHLVRDRAGVKPLYCYWDGTLFLFASELKAFHQHPRFSKAVDLNALRLYMHLGYVPAPYCIFEGAFKLEPGTMLRLDLLTRRIQKTRYWNLYDLYNQPKTGLSFDEASLELEKIMVDAYRYRMKADVPVGVFLSGGYDSTSVAALLNRDRREPLKTFTISYDDPVYNEGHYARAVANHLGTEHYNFHCTEADAQQVMELLPQIYDEPIADGGAIPNILVSVKAAEHVKVVLSADGGDELFAGYGNHYFARQRYRKYFKYPLPVRRLFANYLGLLNRFTDLPIYRVDRIGRLKSVLESPDASTLFERLNQNFTDSEIDKMLYRKTKKLYNKFMNDHLLGQHNDDLDRVIALDFQTFLADDILPKVDRATSFASIEGREPMLDHRLIEFAATLPSHYKLRNDKGKYILRDVVHRYVPKEIMDRPKMGFGVPINVWGLTALRKLFDSCFDDGLVKQQGIFKPQVIRELYQSYRNGNLLSFDKMYVTFTFQQWYRRWMLAAAGMWLAF